LQINAIEEILEAQEEISKLYALKNENIVKIISFKVVPNKDQVEIAIIQEFATHLSLKQILEK